MNSIFKLLFVFVILTGLLVRFYNFSERITYGSEQARSLYVASKYLKEKPSLLGQEYFRTTSRGHKIFSGAIFSYILVPLILVFKYSPLMITSFFSIVNVFTGFLIFIYFYRKKKYKLGIVASFLFLFNSYMIYHSMFIWILNFMPLVGLLLYFLLAKKYKNNSDYLTIGTMCGLGINFHFPFILPAALIFIWLFFNIKKNLWIAYAILLIGFLLGNFSIVVFDLRHNFYHFRTLMEYFSDSFTSSGNANISYYWFLYLYPLLAILLANIILKIKNSKVLALVMLLYLFVNMNSKYVDFKKPTGMSTGLVYNDIIKAAKIISRDVQGHFNVVSLLDFDTRGYVLRYPVEFIFDKKIESELGYEESRVVYALSKKGYDFNVSSVWEVNSVCPCATMSLGSVGNGYVVTKLTKI